MFDIVQDAKKLQDFIHTMEQADTSCRIIGRHRKKLKELISCMNENALVEWNNQ